MTTSFHRAERASQRLERNQICPLDTVLGRRSLLVARLDELASGYGHSGFTVAPDIQANWLAPVDEAAGRQFRLQNALERAVDGLLSLLPDCVSPSTTSSTAGPAPLKAAPRMPCSPPAAAAGAAAAGRSARPIRLVNAVFHGHAAAGRLGLGKGQSQQRRRLNVGDHVGARVTGRQHRARLAGGQGSAGKTTMARHSAGGTTWPHAPSALAGSRHKSAQPAGGGVVRMAFQRACLFENALGTPAKLAKVARQRNRRQPPGRRRAAAHPQRNPVLHANRQRHNRPSCWL
jgi:hypothetical protein